MPRYSGKTYYRDTIGISYIREQVYQSLSLHTHTQQEPTTAIRLEGISFHSTLMARLPPIIMDGRRKCSRTPWSSPIPHTHVRVPSCPPEGTGSVGKPQTSSTRRRVPGWRIHGSVEDTKLSTNKQHSLSVFSAFVEHVLFVPSAPDVEQV